MRMSLQPVVAHQHGCTPSVMCRCQEPLQRGEHLQREGGDELFGPGGEEERH